MRCRLPWILNQEPLTKLYELNLSHDDLKLKEAVITLVLRLYNIYQMLALMVYDENFHVRIFDA